MRILNVKELNAVAGAEIYGDWRDGLTPEEIAYHEQLAYEAGLAAWANMMGDGYDGDRMPDWEWMEKHSQPNYGI